MAATNLRNAILLLFFIDYPDNDFDSVIQIIGPAVESPQLPIVSKCTFFHFKPTKSFVSNKIFLQVNTFRVRNVQPIPSDSTATRVPASVTDTTHSVPEWAANFNPPTSRNIQKNNCNPVDLKRNNEINKRIRATPKNVNQSSDTTSSNPGLRICETHVWLCWCCCGWLPARRIARSLPPFRCRP